MGSTQHALQEVASDITDEIISSAEEATRGDPGIEPVVDNARGPFTLKITLSGYLLLHISFPLVFGTVKLIMTLHGYSFVPTILDWMIGGLFVFM